MSVHSHPHGSSGSGDGGMIRVDLRRSATRKDVRIPIMMRQRSHNYFHAEICDLSIEGFCLFYTGSLSETVEIMIRIDNFAPLTAHIRWHRGDQYGCQFVKPLYPAVFDHMVSQLNSQGFG